MRLRILIRREIIQTLMRPDRSIKVHPLLGSSQKLSQRFIKWKRFCSVVIPPTLGVRGTQCVENRFFGDLNHRGKKPIDGWMLFVEHFHVMDEWRLVVGNAVRGRKRNGQVEAAVAASGAGTRETERDPSGQAAKLTRVERRIGRQDDNDRSLLPLCLLHFPDVSQYLKLTSNRHAADM